MNYKVEIPCLVIGVSTIISVGCKKEDSKPNVIFILADDLGWSQTSVYGSNYYNTPNIDRLAAEGICFTKAYSAGSVSSPTRASIMTGKYPARLHLTNYIPGDNRDQYPLTIPDWKKFLTLDEYTLGELFKEQGYKTAMFGKWHLSVTKLGLESLLYNPDKQGFDQNIIVDKPDWKDDPEHDPHKSDSIGNRSEKFIRENAENRFFLFVSFNAIHDPLMEKADSIARWKRVIGSDKQENNPVIAAMLSRMDRNIGKIMNVVDALNLAVNTMIVFYSDNGGLESYAKQTPLRKGKGWLYEGGIRVPLVIKWPGVVAKGKVSKEVVSSIDFMPTFCDLFNVERNSGVDGISLLSHLKTGAPLPERNLYWHYPHYHGSGMIPGGAIRSSKWKLVEWYEKSLLEGGESAFELFDIENDLSESVNLADSLKTVTMKLSGELQRWREDINAQMPVPNLKYTDVNIE